MLPLSKCLGYVFGTPQTVYLSIAQGFRPRRPKLKESYVNILSKKDEDVMLRNVRTFQQIAIVLKELGPQTYKCLQEEFDGTQMLVDAQGRVPRAFLPEGEADELVMGKRAWATKYLHQLMTGNMAYLEGLHQRDIAGVLDFLPLIHSGEGEEWAEQAKQGRQEWREARKLGRT
jgi:hypothetical protein